MGEALGSLQIGDIGFDGLLQDEEDFTEDV